MRLLLGCKQNIGFFDNYYNQFGNIIIYINAKLQED